VACLILGSLLCYSKYRDSAKKDRRLWLASSLLLAFFGALTKETAIIVPALIFSYVWVFCEQNSSRKARVLASFRATIPYAVVSFSFLLMRALALKSLTPPFTSAGRIRVLLAWPEAIVFYVSHMLFPFRLSVFYKLLTVSHPGPQNFIFPVVLMLAGGVGLFYGSRRSRVFAFLAMWWAIMMVPVLNVTLWHNAENLHDRYMYLPSVAVCIALASLLALLRELHYTKTTLGALVLIAAGYALVTVRELPYWRNDYVLAEHGIEISPGHPIAPQLMGNALIRHGRVSEAIPYFVESLDAMPGNVDTLCNLGFCYSEINAISLAEECISKAMAVDESEPRAHLVLGMIRSKQNRLEEAEAEYRRGIELQRVPKSVTLFHYYLGNVLYVKGDVAGALREYQVELQNDAATDPAFEKARQRVNAIQGSVAPPQLPER
jgi:Flp pilus assembly protein TadD